MVCNCNEEVDFYDLNIFNMLKRSNEKNLQALEKGVVSKHMTGSQVALLSRLNLVGSGEKVFAKLL